MKNIAFKKWVKNTSITVISLFMLFMLFYWFMTNDRGNNYLKEFSYEIKTTLSKTDFKVVSNEQIASKNIKLTIIKSIKTNIQKTLYNAGLMSGGAEFGEKYVLKSNNSKEIIICKGRFMGDYLIGLEIEHKNLKKEVLAEIKTNFEKTFSNYEIIWTEM